MKKFVGFYDNGTYKVGCNGAAVYLFDEFDNELARFKDFPHAYRAVFKPDSNIIAVKSTSNYLGFYDLDKRKLLKKIILDSNEPQDGGFAFSSDGKLLYNIELYGDDKTCWTKLAVYNTNDYNVTYYDFGRNNALELVEYDQESGKIYLLAYNRKHIGLFSKGFIGILENESIQNIKNIKEKEFRKIILYKLWENSGFTDQFKRLDDKNVLEKRTDMSLADIYERL